MMVPYSFKRCCFLGKTDLNEVKAHVRIAERSGKGASATLILYSTGCEVIASLQEVVVRVWSGRKLNAPQARML